MYVQNDAYKLKHNVQNADIFIFSAVQNDANLLTFLPGCAIITALGGG